MHSNANLGTSPAGLRTPVGPALSKSPKNVRIPRFQDRFDRPAHARGPMRVVARESPVTSSSGNGANGANGSNGANGAKPLPPTTPTAVEAEDWFFTESGQKGWVEAMELNTLTPEMPALLKEMGVSYDPEKLSEVMNTRQSELYVRAARVAGTLGTFVAKLGQDYATGRLEANMPKRAARLRDLLAELGPSFVKIGQALSARPDLLPRTYLETLSELQDKLPSFPHKIAMTVIQEELGRPVESVFASISSAPVAAASLGQVYKGTLRTGETVAIKVQRPGIGENIALDMVLLRRLMAVIDRNVDFVTQPLVPLVDEFAGRLFAELDYVMEGHNCERFRDLYCNMPRIRTPSIFWDYSSRRVLTMEWIEGIKLTDTENMEKYGMDVVDFVDVGIECTLRQLLEAGFFHADPHPGNLLATREGDLVYLDFGMMSTAPEYARYALIAHVVHLVNRDYDAMCRDYYDLDFMDRSVDTSPIAPALAAFFDDVLDQSVTQLNFKAIVDGLGEVLFAFPFRVPSYYALILRSLTVLEGMALTADPNYKLLGKAYPYMAKRLLTDPVPELRASFEDLVLQDGRFRWNRLENLMREGSKSSDFDPSQLWLLAEWLVTPSAETVRDPLVLELSKMLDAWAAGNARRGISERMGEDATAGRLFPEQPGESIARQRAELVANLISERLGGLVPEGKGSGPMGIYTPGDFEKAVSNLTKSAEQTAPRLYNLLSQPGAIDMMARFTQQVTQRFTARSIKFFVGTQEVAEERRG
ncbi:hypothetical protein BSKO_08664 [Bryopsis sp. KO-2023]|nr:hypothetical protein BSKO_08664 [Bryopsis sp. KO-2023]